MHEEIKKLKQVIKLQDLAFEVRIELLQTLQIENAKLRNRIEELERELGIRRKAILPRVSYPHGA